MNDTRDLDGERRALRGVYTRAWHKHRDRLPLEPLEALLVDVIALHPEYHALMTDPEVADRDFQEAAGGTNPFIHLGLHVALREQLAADRPAGIKAVYDGLKARYGDPHALEHAVMECLALVLWEAQAANRAPDEAELLERMRRLG